MTPLLEVRGLTRRYGSRVALAGASFVIGQGEIFGVLGPNGAGKTTTFEILSGLRRSDSGELRWRGIAISPTDTDYRRRIGVVFQKPSVDDKLTARENLRLGAALYGLVGREAGRRIDESLVVTELQGRADEPISRFSGGMRRRLELARVLLHEPELLILDEPTHGLDPGFFRRFWDHVASLRDQRGLSVLLTTHDPEEGDRCDRLALLDGGRVVAEGTPQELKQQIGGDVILIQADDAESLIEPLRERLGVEASVSGNLLRIARPRGHELIPRLVEALPAGRLRSVGLHPPNLADVFIQMTGRGLVS